MGKYWIVMILSTAVGGLAVSLVPRPFVIPVYILTTLVILVTAFGLHDAVLRSGRGAMPFDDEDRRDKTAGSTKRA
jgi:hypothetical protein